ncbi:B3 DNA binding domain containing protein [Trema orientale]|uniref:B3 DNA binding domain containing protein n=1 Tax=Trema orientale TaxID=63057 RepID=A0A2P5FHX9_TREOI|nr:B3 DNA binding domain containing protein [Trema orientale]
MENNTNNGNDEKKLLFEKITTKTDIKNKFLRLSKSDAKKLLPTSDDNKAATPSTWQINFRNESGDSLKFDCSHRKIDKSNAYVLDGKNWRWYVSENRLKEGDTVKFYKHLGDGQNLFFIIELEHTTADPGPGGSKAENDFPEIPSAPANLSSIPVVSAPSPSADQTRTPINDDYIHLLEVMCDDQPQGRSGFGPPPNIGDDNQLCNSDILVGRANQSYFDQYINEYGQGLLNELDSNQNKHVKPFVLSSVESIMKIIETNHIGQVEYKDLSSQIATYWGPISVFNQILPLNNLLEEWLGRHSELEQIKKLLDDLSLLKKLVDESLGKLSEFERTKKPVDGSKTHEIIEREVEDQRKNLEFAKRRLEEYTKQAEEDKSRIEEDNNHVVRRWGFTIPSN